MVGHQKPVAKGAGDLHHVALFQVAQIVGRDAHRGLTVVVGGNAFDGERQVVVALAFSGARAGHRVHAQVMRLAVGVCPWRDDAHRLAFEQRHEMATAVEHDVVHGAFGTVGGEAKVACDRGVEGPFGAVQIQVGMRGRPRGVGGGGRDCCVDLQRLARVCFCCFLGDFGSHWLQRWELVPAELVGQRVRRCLRHRVPVVDAAGRAR